jgi:hypothetical protein
VFLPPAAPSLAAGLRREGRHLAKVSRSVTASAQAAAGSRNGMEITHAAASYSPQVTRPATKASAHSPAGMQRLVRAAVQDTTLLLHGAIAGAPRRSETDAAGRPRRPRAPPARCCRVLHAASRMGNSGAGRAGRQCRAKPHDERCDAQRRLARGSRAR